MRKLIFTVFVCLVFFAGCSKSESKSNYAVTDLVSGEIEVDTIERSKKSENLNKGKTSKYDIDLTKYNYNMITAITYEFVVTPAKYKDKTVKITGQFASEVYEGERYFGALVWDPTGCCPAGLDFIPPVGMKYPEDFPEMGTELTVTGRLKMVNDENGEYLRFFADKVIF